MSSALLKKRIMLSMEAEGVFGDTAAKINSTQIAKDCPYPIEKLSIGSESTSDSRTGTRENDDEANKNITVAGQTIQSDTSDTAATSYHRNTDNGVRTKKVWMASGVTKREPRVGADYQALIE